MRTPPSFRVSCFIVCLCVYVCVCVCVCACVSSFSPPARQYRHGQEYIERDFSKDEFRVWQYPVFAAMGVLCGFVGPLYVNFRLNMLKVCQVPASSPPRPACRT